MSLSITKFFTFPHDSLGRRFISGSFWILLGSIAARGVSALAVIGVAREVGTESFGELGIVQTSINMFGAFATFGMADTLIKHIAEFSKVDPQRAGRIIALSTVVTLGMSTFLAIVFFLLSPWLSEAMLNNAEMSSILQFAAFLLLFQCILESQMGILVGFGSFRFLSLITAVQAILYGFGMYIGAITYGIKGAVIGNAIAFFILIIINLIIIKHLIRNSIITIQWRQYRQEIPILYGFSLPLALSGLISAPLQWLCSVILVNMPGGYTQMGLYQAAFRIRSMVMMIGDSMARPLISLLSTPEGGRSIALQRTNLLGGWFIAIAFTLPIIFFPEVFDLIFGQDFAGENFRRTALIVVMTFIVFLCQQALFRSFVAQGLAWFRAVYQIALSLFFLPAVYFLSPYGAVGYAGAFFLGVIIFYIIALPYCSQKGLIPPGTLLSLESLIIWCALLIAAGVSFWGVSLKLRMVIDFFVFVILSVSIYRLVIRIKKT